MPTWTDCRVEMREAGAVCFACDDADVRIEEPAIAISWIDEQGPVVWAGEGDGRGGYRLVCRSRPRTATLERRGDALLEGAWREEGSEGTWRVRLGACG